MNEKQHQSRLRVKIVLALFVIISISLLCNGQSKSELSGKSTIYIDKQGIMRWSADNKEVVLFGTNYTVPFAYSYRAHKTLGVSHEKAIDEDIYHMARLGLDAFRVHVWDCEISDSIGNLLENEHLRLFDYQLKKMKERGMKFLITPIAYWDNGYPEPAKKTPGFSSKYGKNKCLVNPEAIKAQENYLFQFMNHVNKYTGLAIKDDPDIIAFEVCNEPHHRGSAEETTRFINRLVAAIKKSGCNKPVFYNISHSIHLADAYFNADIQGGTFQWYPSGLVSGHEQMGNFLPNVSSYSIPFTANPKFQQMAKVVYEFDAADIGQSYMYPYMAKSFREAGFQFATQFAYDPLHLAYANTEYTTHYMNLAYAPQKALSLKIANEVFHTLPLGKTISATYPNDSVFSSFRVSYKADLAEINTEEKYLYTNNTGTKPIAAERLKQITGYGMSPVISYVGCGAYFLDKLEEGIWRLEVMPDAVWVRDPFEKASPKKEVAVILWRTWRMEINLPDLGEDYSIIALNDGNKFNEKATGKAINISPGTYLLIRNGKTSVWKANDRWNNIILKEFIAPPASCNKTYFLHQPSEEVSTGKTLKISAKVVSSDAPDTVQLFVYSGWRTEAFKMIRETAYTYAAEIPARLLKPGFLKYFITITAKGIDTTYPDVIQGRPTDWDFYGLHPFQVRVVPASNPICIFDAASDFDLVLGQRGYQSFVLQPSENGKNTVMKVAVERLKEIDPENKLAPSKNDYSFKFCFRNKIEGRFSDLDSCCKIVLHGHSLTDKPCTIQLALITNEGSAFGGLIQLKPQDGTYILKLNDLKKVRFVNLPEVYPTFLHYYFEGNNSKRFDIKQVESLQFSIGPGIPESEYNEVHSIAIESVMLE